MEASPSETPCTPTREPSEGATSPLPPPRNSMDDANCHGTRKRPRLDSGERAYRSMSAEPSSVTLAPNSDAPEPMPASSSPKGTPSPKAPAAATTDDDLPEHPLGTPSKVTINVRDSALDGSPPPSTGAEAGSSEPKGEEEEEEKQEQEQEHDDQIEEQQPAPERSPYVISSPPTLNNSSPRSSLGSPEIEVAEPEYMDGSSGPTVWIKSNEQPIDVDIMQEELLREFPLMGRHESPSGCVHTLAELFREGDNIEPHVRALASWLSSFLRRTQSVSAQWYDWYTGAREFWELMPVLLEHLLQRGNLRGSEDLLMIWDAERDDHSTNPVRVLYESYAILTARTLQVDCQTLLETADDVAVSPDLISPRFVQTLCKTFGEKRDPPLWRGLRTYRWDSDGIINCVMQSFLGAPSRGLNYLSRSLTLELNRNPLDAEFLLSNFRLATVICERWRAYFNAHPDADMNDQPESRSLPRDLLRLFQEVDERIQSMVTKQAPSLTLEILRNLVSHLSFLRRQALVCDEDLTDESVPPGYHKGEEQFNTATELSLNEKIDLIDYAWRADLLKKCIVQGRMDSRITGVETLQDTLVEVWHKYIRNKFDRIPHHPVVEYLADFILNTKLVNYLVGVDSHPQIIQRSKNIVGFLVVTGRYTEKETDVIWDSVISSQDPRTIDAILEMLKGILELSSHPVLVYLCRKALDLPIRFFDNRMNNYCSHVLSFLTKQSRHTGLTKADLAPFELLIKLTRQSTAEPSLPVQKKRELWSFATHELRNIGTFGMDEQDQRDIYKDCVEHIASGSAFSTGSISTLNIFLEQQPHTDVETVKLGTLFDVTPLMINDLSNLHKLEVTANLNFQAFAELLADRMRFVQRLVTFLPDSVDAEQALELWDCLIGNKALSDLSRDLAWRSLAEGLKGYTRRNSFFDRFREIRPNLDPSYYTPLALNFAQQLTEYNSRMANLSPTEAAVEKQSIQGELFWHISIGVPNSDTGARAINLLVRYNLDSVRLGSDTLGRHILAERHSKLVERCITELIKAAAKLKNLNEGGSGSDDESMVIVPSEKDVAAAKLCFVRSFAILKEFMHGIRSQQPQSPLSDSTLLESPKTINGDEMTLQYQPHVGGKPTGIFSLKIGDGENFETLLGRLKETTGFTDCTIIASGRRVDQNLAKHTKLRDMKFLRSGLILIQKTPGSSSGQGTGTVSRLLPLEGEAFKHFQELYDLLGIDDDLGQYVFLFLTTFPPHKNIMDLVFDKSRTLSEVFPADAPYKTMYSVYALKGLLLQRLQEGASCHDLIQHGVQIVSKALISLKMSPRNALTQMELKVAQVLVDCLLQFLKEPVPQPISSMYFEDAESFVSSLQVVISVSQNAENIEQATALTNSSFASMLEASLHSKTVWQYFHTDPSNSMLLRRILLETPNDNIRKSTVANLRSVCTALSNMELSEEPEFVSYFWKNIENLIPQAPRFQNNAEQFFEIAFDIFRRVDDTSENSLPLNQYLETWANILLNFQHEEFPGRWSKDWIVTGLANLIYWCLQLLKAKKSPWSIAHDLPERIFSSHLFPAIQSRDDEVLIPSRVPVLDPTTRGQLYNVLLGMTTDLSGCCRLIESTKDLIPADETSFAWSHGVAQMSEDYTYECTWNFDRFKAIRSPTGFAGMKNLSNTCYMNSLMTQLFMNIKFREFMLSTNLTDSGGSQKLLAETKRLFAYLQETWLKALDPENIASAIVTYENTLIDVSIQMDVDEFYNLLFDRWESQIPAQNDKKTFRNFYGGQIVQQIKSKDCPHVSERLEPFSAIQCEIQGKNTLTESLQAYVEGEMMEGDNKYSCSSCGSYVNAIKRACLKEIPDNLIFHLKRFDYDLMTGVRNKINDYFEFPREIDMTPYTIDYLRDPTQNATPDVFTLVGVLVHSGNAEAGHYYSYIRERPACKDQWVEFNDADVSPFDSQSIKDQCFGGWVEQMYGGLSYPKTWSAYMLFYQRVSSIEAEKIQYLPLAKNGRVNATIPTALANRVHTENESWIRKFCLFDPEHAKFCRLLLEQYRNYSNATCSDDHAMEKSIIQFALNHLEMIFCRQKDCIEVSSILDFLSKLLEKCAECCRIFLDTLVQGESTLRAFLLRCPEELTRKKFVTMITSALSFLRHHEPQLYGLDPEGVEGDSPPNRPSRHSGAFYQVINALKGLWGFLHVHARAWDDYWGLMANLASLGRPESAIMHEAGCLVHPLQMLVLEGRQSMIKVWLHHLQYFKSLEKKRFSLKKLILLVAILLRNSTTEEESAMGTDESYQTSLGRYTITASETGMLTWTFDTSAERGTLHIIFLDKILKSDGVELIVIQDIVRTLLRSSRRLQFVRDIFQTVAQGSQVDPAILAKPYLFAALAFCEACHDPILCKQMIARFSHDVQSIGQSGGDIHLDFFMSARRLQNENFSTQKPLFFKMEILKQTRHFAPTLLMYHEGAVRSATIRFLHQLVFDHSAHELDDERFAEQVESAGQGLLSQCIHTMAQLVEAGKPVDISRAEDFVKVVKHCLETYSPPDEDHTSKNNQIQAQANRLMDQLYSLTVSTPDEILSDVGIDGSEELPSDSESGPICLSD